MEAEVEKTEKRNSDRKVGWEFCTWVVGQIVSKMFRIWMMVFQAGLN